MPAQEPVPASAPTPEPTWKGSIGGGLASTSGNSDTNSHNVSLGAAQNHDHKTRPANRLLEKNDASVVAALVFKIG